MNAIEEKIQGAKYIQDTINSLVLAINIEKRLSRKRLLVQIMELLIETQKTFVDDIENDVKLENYHQNQSEIIQ